MALFDIDHFKLYNDHYGHQAGDEALRQVARCLDKFSRADESVYRYGGEEFLLLLPDCSADDAATAAERLRRSVTDMAHTSRCPAHDAAGGDPERRRVVLVAGFGPLSVADLLQQADEALFQAKAAGRNRVHIATQLDGQLQRLPVSIRPLSV